MKNNKKQPDKNQENGRDTLDQIRPNLGPDDRGEYPEVWNSNPSTAANGLVISGPSHRGTI